MTDHLESLKIVSHILLKVTLDELVFPDSQFTNEKTYHQIKGRNNKLGIKICYWLDSSLPKNNSHFARHIMICCDLQEASCVKIWKPQRL